VVATARIDTLVILGAAGDLTSRLLLPGLASLLDSSRGSDIQLIGVDRDPLTATAWKRLVGTAFAGADAKLAVRVRDASQYLQADVTDAEALGRVFAAAKGRVALYFALPPAVTVLACRTLATMPIPDGTVLAVEKPFGTDLASARALNRLLQTIVPEEQAFRVDHFLGKSTVINLLGLRVE
jgi:glucose-6-phosphate 1-dehydrogenase